MNSEYQINKTTQCPLCWLLMDFILYGHLIWTEAPADFIYWITLMVSFVAWFFLFWWLYLPWWFYPWIRTRVCFPPDGDTGRCRSVRPESAPTTECSSGCSTPTSNKSFTVSIHFFFTVQSVQKAMIQILSDEQDRQQKMKSKMRQVPQGWTFLGGCCLGVTGEGGWSGVFTLIVLSDEPLKPQDRTRPGCGWWGLGWCGRWVGGWRVEWCIYLDGFVGWAADTTG